jgi:NADH dehydrogenase (ubiquinone) 1 alpha subcomplex subunit 9
MSFSQREINVEGAASIAEQCALSPKSPTLVHCSAITADSASKNSFSQTKGLGEQAVKQAFPSATIIRPGLMYGYEDRFLNAMGEFANYTRILPRISPASAVKRPVYVGNVAEAICRLSMEQQAQAKTFQLPGPVAYTIQELHQLFVKYAMREEMTVLSMRPAVYWLWARLIREWRIHPSKFRYSQILGLLESEQLQQGLSGWNDLGMRIEQLDRLESHAIELLRVYRPEDLYHEAVLNKQQQQPAKELN